MTVCGQLLTPKRIVFLGDTGIFFTKKQEIELLVKFKQFEGCKLEKAKWEKYAIDADLQIDREREGQSLGFLTPATNFKTGGHFMVSAYVA